MTPATATERRSEQTTDRNAVRPFRVDVAEAELTELRRRIDATRLPEKETVADSSQGVPLATVQKLARYWATGYDGRKVEARLNAVPNFLTEIDGLFPRMKRMPTSRRATRPGRVASAARSQFA